MIPVTMACGPIVSTMQRSPALALEQPVVIGKPGSVAPDIETVTFAPDTDLTVPLRYNYDKPEKPRISRVFGYLARFFILFQTEKSSREVVIS